MIKTQDENLLIAQKILDHLGGANKLSLMIGAKNFQYHIKDLGFRYAKTHCNNSNHVQIKLMPSDLYKLEFWNICGVDCEVVETIDNVYAENLAETFQKATGLYLA